MKIRANGVELTVVEEGRGDPVIFVHGSLADYRTWHLQVSGFSQKFRAISYSRRCHYPNPWTDYPQDYSIFAERDDLLALLKALEIKKPVHLIGSSYGAFVCALLARDHPELVRSLVLGEPPILSLLVENELISAQRAKFESKIKESALLPLQKENYTAGVKGFIDTVMGEGTFDGLSSESKEKMLGNARTLKYEVTTPERDPFTSSGVRKIALPTLVARGEHSPLMFQLISQELMKYLPRSRLATIPGASHLIHAQNPRVYDETVLSFLSQV